MPSTATTLTETLGHRLHRPAEPEFAAVRGAARWAERARARVVPADPPAWRIGPMAWQVPGGGARLLHWTVADGADFPAGGVLARVRTADDQVYELTAAQAGRLTDDRPAPGSQVGPVLAVPVARDPAALAEEPPVRRWQRPDGRGSWLLTPDRQVLFECDPYRGVVRSFGVGDGALRSEFRPDSDGEPARWQGSVFVDPAGQPVLLAWTGDGRITGWDVGSGKPVIRLTEPAGVSAVLVDEAAWRLAVESNSRMAVGRYRRASVTVWDLRTGERLAKLTEDAWRQRYPGFRQRSARDTLGTRAVNPDGSLQAITDQAVALLRDTATGEDLFRADGPAGASARVAFDASGGLLVAAWESHEQGRVDVYDV